MAEGTKFQSRGIRRTMTLNIYLSKSLTEVLSRFFLFKVSKSKWPNRVPALVRTDCHRREPGQISSMLSPSNPGQKAPGSILQLLGLGYECASPSTYSSSSTVAVQRGGHMGHPPNDPLPP